MSNLSKLKELISILGTTHSINTEICAVLEELSARVYSLEEDRKRLLAASRAQECKIQSLERRYSELLYKVSEK